ncbi:ABC transporter permease [Dactylosporangium sp. NPDC051484]|uniref:ABC transporter permease n=1 Tax=Dactylosporangium sp. NPDC051484 TaxID=3154942 RepID=UPI00344FD286
MRHLGRSLLTAIGTVLGAAAFVSTLGLGSTLNQQVASSFDVRRATEVVVRPESDELGPGWHDPAGLTRLRSLNGVTDAGRRAVYAEQEVRRSAGDDTDPLPVQVIAADPGALRVIGPAMVVGRMFDEFAERERVPVVLLPKSLADRLGITRIGVAVFVKGQPFTVMGIYSDVARRPEALLSIVMPYSVGARMETRFGAVQRDVVIATLPGAAQLIGRQAPFALLPEAPQALRATAPPDPRTLRREVEGSVTRSSLLVSLVALVIGTFSIGNAATAGIATRTGEIGLRRAVGGRRIHVFVQLLGETTVLGAVGGMLGAVLGIGVVAAVSLWNGWVPIIDITLAVGASLACAAAGLVGGLFPAARAMRIQPVAALQR